MGISGIYGIKNKINSKIYVGQAVNFKRRKGEHFSDLNKNKHYNKKLQRSYNKYGENNFEFFILEECNLESLSIKEQEWIFKYKKKDLFNHVLDIQYKQGKSNPNFGNKNSIETLIKMSEGRSKNLNKEKVLEIVNLLKQNISHKDIAQMFGIGRTTITRISCGARWTNVTGGPVIPLVYENGKRVFTEEHKNKIGLKRKGHPVSEEHKEKLRKFHTGRKLSEELKARLSQIHKERFKRRKHGN
jgi:group I intron endonuclease